MATPVTLSAVLKSIQEDGTDPKALVRKSPLMQSIAHKQDFQGKEIAWSVPYAGLGGGSHDATEAEANDQNGRYGLFTTGKARQYFAKRTLDGQLCRQSLKGDVSTEFVDYLKAEIDLASAVVGTRLAQNAYRSHTSSRGRQGSESTTALILATITDAFYFNIGDKVQATATDGGALLNAGAFVSITAIDHATGTLTADGNWATVTDTNGDYLVIKGDRNVGFHGLGSYNPDVAPSGGDSVFGSGVDRSVDKEMLAGVRYVTTGYNVDTCLIRLMSYMQLRPGWDFPGAKIFANGMDVANLKVAKEGQRFIDDANQYEIGIEGFKVGGAMVVEDPFCPEGRFRLVADGAFELHTNNGVTLDAADGNDIRKGAGDTYSLTCLVDGDFTSPKPYGLATGTWPTT